MSGGGSQTSTTVNKTELPEWVSKAGQDNYKKAVDLDNTALQQYGGNRVAPISGTTQSAIDALKANQNNGINLTNQAGGIFSGIAGAPANANLSEYMNPYTDEVVNKSMDALDDQRIRALMGNADAATKASAFGGSRAAIVDAVTNAETAKSAGLLSAQLRSDAFNNAQSARDADYRNKLSAGQGLLSTGAQVQDQQLGNFNALLGAGAIEQNQGQKVIDADMAKFNEQRDKELNDLNTRLSALGMTPYPSSSTSSTTTPTQGTDWATTGLGALSLVLGLSDDTMKTDKQKVGTDPDTGLDIWAFRYKGDPKYYPKSVGVMASDVEKKVPAAVHKMPGGKRAIDYGMLAKGL